MRMRGASCWEILRIGTAKRRLIYDTVALNPWPERKTQTSLA